MDRTVPPGAAILLDFIRGLETGRSDSSAYNVIYANKQDKLPKPITTMTVAELQEHQTEGWPAKSTAAGGYQFMRATLRDLRKELGLRDGQMFDPNLQDRLGYHLLKRRGYEAFVAGKLSVQGFALNLAKEWASLPVLAHTRGSERQVQRGQSYYAGDGLNKSLVKPEAVEAILASVLKAGSFPVPPPPDIDPYPDPIPTVPLPPATKHGIGGWIVAAVVIAAALAALAIFTPIF